MTTTLPTGPLTCHEVGGECGSGTVRPRLVADAGLVPRWFPLYIYYGARLLGHELSDLTRRRLSPHPAAHLGLGLGVRVRVGVGVGVRVGVGIRVSYP